MPVKLFVGGLSFTTSSEGLRQAFARFGSVTSAAVMTDRETGRSRGFGFVEMGTPEEAERAIGGMNGTNLDGRTLRVDKATPRGASPRAGAGPRPGGYGGPRAGGGMARPGGGPPRPGGPPAFGDRSRFGGGGLGGFGGGELPAAEGRRGGARRADGRRDDGPGRGPQGEQRRGKGPGRGRPNVQRRSNDRGRRSLDDDGGGYR